MSRVVFLGDSNVGKTSLIYQMIYGIFEEQSNPTIGIDFQVKKYNVCLDNETKEISLQFFDTAGQEAFKSIAVQYFRDANIIVVVYSVNNAKSFESVKNWVKLVKDSKTTHEIQFFLIGNKNDLDEERYISEEDGQTLAEQIGAKFFEASARLGTNILQISNELALSSAKIMKEIEEKENNARIKLNEQNTEEKKCC